MKSIHTYGISPNDALDKTLSAHISSKTLLEINVKHDVAIDE